MLNNPTSIEARELIAAEYGVQAPLKPQPSSFSDSSRIGSPQHDASARCAPCPRCRQCFERIICITHCTQLQKGVGVLASRRVGRVHLVVHGFVFWSPVPMPMRPLLDVHLQAVRDSYCAQAPGLFKRACSEGLYDWLLQCAQVPVLWVTGSPSQRIVLDTQGIPSKMCWFIVLSCPRGSFLELTCRQSGVATPVKHWGSAREVQRGLYELLVQGLVSEQADLTPAFDGIVTSSSKLLQSVPGPVQQV